MVPLPKPVPPDIRACRASLLPGMQLIATNSVLKSLHCLPGQTTFERCIPSCKSAAIGRELLNTPQFFLAVPIGLQNQTCIAAMLSRLTFVYHVLGGCVMRAISPLFSIFLLLSGCSNHPLQDDVTGYDTNDIVQKLRCEAQSAIFAELQSREPLNNPSSMAQ